MAVAGGSSGAEQSVEEIGIAEITVKIHRDHIMKKWVRGRWQIW